MQEYQWDDNLMNLEFLWQTEKQTASDTLGVRGEDSIEINNLINIFFRLSYHRGEYEQSESNEHYFIAFANLTYERLPYSLRAIHSLWIKGYYLEAIVVYRQILETLVTLRYFHKYPDQTKKHFMATRFKDRVRYSEMFEEIAPGFYKRWYGDTYAHMAHGGISTKLFREKDSSTGQREVLMGCEFNLEKSNFVTNSTILISYGYLNYMNIFLPSITSKISPTMKNRIQDISAHIKNKYLKKTDNDFFKAILPLICK